jgi:DNA replication protein DnaC
MNTTEANFEMQRRMDQWKRQAGELYAETDSEKLPNKLASSKVLAHTFKGGKGLLVIGTPGTGKTRSVWALLKGYMLNGWTVWSPSGIQFANLASKYTGAEYIGGYEDWMTSACKLNVVFIDDAFKSKMTESFERVLWDLLERRSHVRRPVIITANGSGKDLKERMTPAGQSDRADAIFRRITEFMIVVKF